MLTSTVFYKSYPNNPLFWRTYSFALKVFTRNWIVLLFSSEFNRENERSHSCQKRFIAWSCPIRSLQGIKPIRERNVLSFRKAFASTDLWSTRYTKMLRPVSGADGQWADEQEALDQPSEHLTWTRPLLNWWDWEITYLCSGGLCCDLNPFVLPSHS